VLQKLTISCARDWRMQITWYYPWHLILTSLQVVHFSKFCYAYLCIFLLSKLDWSLLGVTVPRLWLSESTLHLFVSREKNVRILMLVHTSSNNCNVNKKISARKVIFFSCIYLVHWWKALIYEFGSCYTGYRIQSHADNTGKMIFMYLCSI